MEHYYHLTTHDHSSCKGRQYHEVDWCTWWKAAVKGQNLEVRQVKAAVEKIAHQRSEQIAHEMKN